MAVKNKDLWECLLGEFERWDEKGLEVRLWYTPRGVERHRYCVCAAAKAALDIDPSPQWVDDSYHIVRDDTSPG